MTLPTIEQIPALTYAEQAIWLIRASESTVSGWVGSIRAVLEMTSFAEGLVYLERRYMATIAVRTSDGNIPHTVMMSVFHAEGVMRQAAWERDKAAKGEAV